MTITAIITITGWVLAVLGWAARFYANQIWRSRYNELNERWAAKAMDVNKPGLEHANKQQQELIDENTKLVGLCAQKDEEIRKKMIEIDTLKANAAKRSPYKLKGRPEVIGAIKYLFGKPLGKRYAKYSRISQEDIAQRLGVTDSTISDIALGKSYRQVLPSKGLKKALEVLGRG